MKKSMRMLALFLCFVMVLGLFPTVRAEEAPVLANADEIVVYYTNDVHTYIDKDLSYDNLADLKTQTAEQAAGVLLVDAGDAVQGTAYGSMDKGATIIELMNAAGYDLATLGNHEFDYGMDGCMNVIDWAEFPYVSANFYHEENGVVGETVLDAYKVFEVGGKKIAFIGVTTPESFTKSTPAYFQDEDGNYIYGIAGGIDGEALYAAVQTAIDAASAEADLVVGLVHLGDDLSSQPWTSEEMIANTTGLDAVIDGHSHSTVPMKEVLDEGGNTVILTQTGEYFGAIGKMTISADGSISTELLTEWTGSDAEVKAIKDEWLTSVDTLLGEVIGTAEVALDNYDADGNRLVRTQETNTGDFCADALYYLFDNMDMDVDVAIMNGGGIRNNVAITGELTYKTCKTIHTFGNVACLQTVTGQQILDALEWGARQAPDVQVGGFLHVSGLKYTIDASVTSTVQYDDKTVWTGGPTGEYRVKDVQVYNKETGSWDALDLTASYNLAGYNYTLRDLGDGFAMFDGAVNVLDYVMEDYMVLANYIQGFEDATVKGTNSPLNAKYANFGSDYSTTAGSGRITVLASEQEDDGKILIGGLENNIWMTKYGNVYMDIEVADFFELGFGWADLVTVKFLDQELTIPVVPTYSYVDSGKAAVIAAKNDAGNPTGYLSLAINMGNFAETYGIATKHTDESGNWYWVACEGVEFPIEVTFEMAEDDGYMAEYLLHELSRTNNREDYADLTDEAFANFRAVATTGMGEGKLYRSSSPINPEIGRNTYALAAAEAAGVTVVMNLADTAEEAAAYEGFEGSYYANQKVIYLGLGVDFAAEDFKTGLAAGLRHFAENEGTYLVHCNEGKDRAGFVSALLECLMGASAEEVVADYMVTYYNYYGVESGTEKYDAIANSNIVKSLETAFGVEDLYTADLAAEAAAYIAEIGLSDDEITALKNNLGGEKSENVVILYTNDVHTYIDKNLSYDNIADMKQTTERTDAGVLLVDAGDHIQGTAYGSMDKGATIIELMNAAGYDLATLGNHEFDYTMEGAMNVIEWAEFPYVSANFYHEDPENPGAGSLTEDGWEIRDPVLEPFELFEVGGQTIAIIGVTTPESFTKSTPAYFQDEDGNYIYGIAGGTDGQELYDYVQFAINAAKLCEPDVIIALAHLGDDPASQPWTSEELIANTTGLDAVIDGHSHSTVPMKEVLDEDGNTVILTQTGEYFDAIGKMTITPDGTISTELVTEWEGSDENVKAIQDAWITSVDEQLGEVIGYTDIVFDNYDENGSRLVRKYETNTGNLAADALYYLFDNMGLDVDVAIMNGGGVRNKAVTGEISYKTCKTIHTFGNVACLQTITGQQLLDALEWGARDTDAAECGGFLQVSGITYEVNTAIPSTVQKDDKGVWTGGPTGAYRVGNVKIWQDGEWVDLDLNATYNLAGYNYTLRDLGDGFAMFDGAVNVLDYVMEDYMVLANYIKSFPVNENGLHEIPVDDERYASVYGEGRISIFQGFEDVAIDTFYFEPVMWALEMGITTGVTDTTFAPGREIMRAEAVTFLWRAAGSPDPTGVNPFVDVKESDFFCKAAVWAYEQGITTGTTATTFSPYKTCTRAEVVTFLWRAEGQPEPTTAENPFVDVKNTDFYYTAVLWAVEKGITNGMDTTHFGPLLVCNRAQVVTFLYRTAQLAETEPEEPEQPEDPELPVDPDTTYSITIKTKGEATAFSEVGEAAAGEVVYFMVDPEYGWVLTGVESFPTNEGIVLYYMGANVYELTMPARDVVLTFVYEEAQGSAHYITTNCTGGVAVADCDFDDDLNDFAKAGEYVLFMVLPDEGMTLDLETDVSVKVNGNAYDGWFAIGEMEGIYLFEVYMPDADLTVDITCTSGNGANAAAARIPVTVE